MKSEAVIIGQCRLFQMGESFYAVFDPVPGCDLDALAPLDEATDPPISGEEAATNPASP